MATAASVSPYRPSTIYLNDAEQRRYSLGRAIIAQADRITGERKNSFELEISEEIERKLPADVKRHGGVYVPWSLKIDTQAARRSEERIRAGLDTATTTKGKEVVFTEPQSFIEYLYNRMVVKALGAQTMSGLQGNLSFPRQTGKVTGSWMTENPGSDVAESNLTLDAVLMSPKTYQSTTSFSRQLLAQSQSIVDIDNLVRSDLALDGALAFDKAALVGDGTSGAPKGVLSTTGTQSYVMAADTGTGGKPAYADILGMEELIEEVNADSLGSYGWATVPSIKALLRQTPVLANTIAFPVWQNGDTIDSYTAKITNQLPKTLSKGASGNVLTVLILGIWSQMILGLWGSGYELVVDPYRLKKQGMIELTTFVLADVGIRHPTAFVYSNAVAKS